MPASVAKKVLIAAKQQRAMEEQATLLQQDIFNLSAQVDNFNAIVRELRAKDSIGRGASEARESIIRIGELERSALQAEVTRLNRDLRRQKSRTKWTAAAGIIIAGLTFLIFK